LALTRLILICDVRNRDEMKRFLTILGATVLLTFFALLAPGVVLALFVIPSALLSLCRHHSPRCTVIRSAVFALVLCAVWIVTYYPISRFFIMGEVVNPDGTTGHVSLLGDEPKRLVLGCLYLVASSVAGGLLSVAKERKKMRTTASTATNGPAAGRSI